MQLRSRGFAPKLGNVLVGTALIGATLLLAGCAANADTPAQAEESNGSSSRVVETAQGDVTVPADPQRVVVLNYALAGYLYDLDVPVAATTSEDFDHDAAFSELWGDAPSQDGTEFLTWGMDGFDLEGILELEPDLIIAGGVGLPNGLAVDSYEQLSKIAPTVVVDQQLTTWQQQFEFIADDVLGREDDFDSAVDAYDARVAEVRDAITVPETPVAVLTITADNTPYLLFEDSGLPTALAEVGFEPAKLVEKYELEPYAPGGDMAELSTEQAGQMLADVPTLFITGFNTDTTDVATLGKSPLWAGLPAFADDRAYDLPYWSVRGDYDEALALLDDIEQQFS